MTYSELVKEVAKKSGVTQAVAKDVLAAQKEIIVEAIAAGDSVAIHGFGTFKSATSAARTGKHPKTGEAVEVAAKKRMVFKPAANVKAALNGGEKA